MEKTKITKPTYLNHLPVKKRVEVRERLARINKALKKQNELLTEMFIFPNKHYQEVIEKFLKGRASWEELEAVGLSTRERYKEILK